MLRRPIITVLLLTTMSAVAQAQMKSSQPAVSQAELDAIRAATEKYKDVKVAEKEGYILPGNMCVVAAHEGAPKQLGAMGLHYVRPDLLKITAQQPKVNGEGTHTDFLKPAILMYEPQADGSLKLTGIENLIWAKAWHDAGNKAPPSFNGFDYYYIHDNPETPNDEAHGFLPHYELHFWLYRDNPAGMFSPF
ncbi:MAG TPA: hypothetical protein VGD27_17280, partial [Longimicrobiales bacterium]